MRRAFTLIELLVVIAIIAILAAIMFPVFTQAKRTAKQTVCIVHLRQIGMAMMMYTTDHDERWVPACNTSPLAGFAPQQFWIGYDNNNSPLSGGFYGEVNAPATGAPRPGMIDPYMKSEKIKVCPEQPGNWQMALAYNMFHPGQGSAYYSTNPAAQGNEFGPGTYQLSPDASGILNAIAIADGQMDDPAQTLVLWEHNARVPMCNFLQSVDFFDGPPISEPDLAEHFNFLHRNGATTLWGDGHTKRQLFAQLRRPMFSVRKDIYP
jgi:prepilin-type N-terminal cleavage/methylation domain-containing protein/prepilin-type processing-associated H-X9-DG protein